jgi:hypothetical protein
MAIKYQGIGRGMLCMYPKILTYHQHFDMQPFFEWDLKVLPLVIEWFERAGTIQSVDEDEIGKRKRAIYQFIHAMPEVFEPVRVTAKRKRYLRLR